MHGSRVHEDAAHSFRIFCRVSICWTARITRWLRSLSGIWILRRSSRCLISVHGNSRRTDRDRRWINWCLVHMGLRFFLWIFGSWPIGLVTRLLIFMRIHFLPSFPYTFINLFVVFFCIPLIDLINMKERKRKKRLEKKHIFRKIIQMCKRLYRQLHPS